MKGCCCEFTYFNREVKVFQAVLFFLCQSSWPSFVHNVPEAASVYVEIISSDSKVSQE